MVHFAHRVRLFVVSFLAMCLAGFGLLSPAHAANGTLTVKFHYANPANVSNFAAWVWLTGGGTGTVSGANTISGTGGTWVPVNNAGTDAYGTIGSFTINNAVNVNSVGIIINSGASWAGTTKDAQSGTDRFITIAGASTEVWMSSSSPTILTTDPNPTPTVTPTPTGSTLNVKFHYAGSGSTTGYAAWVWVSSPGTGTVGGANTTSATGGTWVPVNNAGTDAYGSIGTFTISNAVNVTQVGIIINSGATWTGTTKDPQSGVDRFITIAGADTEVWLSATSPTIATANPTPTATPTPTVTPTTPPTGSTLSVTIHYTNTAGTTGYAAWIWLPVGATGNVTGTGTTSVTGVGPGTWVPIDNAGSDSYGAIAKFDVTNAVGVTQLGVIINSGATWTGTTKDAQSGVDRFITIAGDTTEVWMNDTAPDISTTDPGNGGGGGGGSAPVATSLSASSGNRGDSITISGTNLKVGDVEPLVTVGGVTAVINSSTATEVIFSVPDIVADGDAPVVLTNDNGSTASLAFTVIPSTPSTSPTLDSFSPQVARANDVVTVTGTNLVNVVATLDGNALTIGAEVTDTSFSFTVPETMTPGAYLLFVTADGGTTSALYTIVGAAPTITSLSATSGAVGDLITIEGTDFTGVTSVQFGGVDADLFSADTLFTDTSITVPVPTGAITGVVTVVTPAGSAESADTFTVDGGPNPPTGPTITSLSSTSGVAGDIITISGTGLASATSVTFNGVEADLTNPDTVISDTSITVVVPSSATSGAISVVTLEGTATSTDAFTINEPPLPLVGITSVNSESGLPGDVMEIAGFGFGTDPVVSVGDFNAFVIDATDSLVRVVIPDGVLAGPVTVTVTATDGTATSSYTIPTPPPTIDALSDLAGVVGSTVTITGSNLTGVTSVQFNGIEADLTDPAVLLSDSEITVVVPTDATTGSISVTTPGGTVTSDDTFTVVSPPTIESLSVTSGKPGDTVVITGTNLATADSVIFNDAEADLTDPAVAITDTSITVLVPDEASTGPITVTTAAGDVVSSEAFEILLPPIIDSLSSLKGKPGSKLTINGENFNSVTGVRFDGADNGDGVDNSVLADIYAKGVEMTNTSITVFVPVGASSGSITVITPGGEATSDDTFTILNPPQVLTMSLTTVKSGDIVRVTGTDLDGASIRIRGVLARIRTGATDTSLSFIVPTITTFGKTTLVLTTPGGIATKSMNVISMNPVIKSFTQSQSKKRGVGTVTVTGLNLAGATVKVGNFTARVRSGATATKLVFTLPALMGSTTKGSFVITTRYGTATSSKTLKVTLK